MARPIRIEFGGALYHVTARGDPKLNQTALKGMSVSMPPAKVREEIVLKAQQIAVDAERAAEPYRVQPPASSPSANPSSKPPSPAN